MRHQLLQNTHKILIKIGTRTLTNQHNHPDQQQIKQLIQQITQLHQNNKKIILVTSGAVGAGMGILKLKKRPTNLPQLQACAALGQPQLITTYQQHLAKKNIHAAQILLTHDDLKNRQRHLNARNTLTTLINQNIIPIINENDTVSNTELKIGDNDTLSALVASLLNTDLLILLTTTNGLIKNYNTPQAQRIPHLTKIDKQTETIAHGTPNPTAQGGMTTKIQAAKIAAHSGIPTLIANGRQKNILPKLLNAHDHGTLILPQPNKLKSRKRWIAFFHRPTAQITIDNGAKTALLNHGKSLLTNGILHTQGNYKQNDTLSIQDTQGNEIARGLAAYNKPQKNQPTPTPKIAIHRDNLAIL